MRFDIRSELALLCGVNISVFLFNHLLMEAVCIALVFLVQCMSGRKNGAWKMVLVYGVFVGVQIYILPLLPGLARAIISVPVVQFRKMFPLLMVFILIIRTTKVSEIIATMERMHVSKAITVSLAVTIRYFPTMFEEWVSIREAMSIRRISAFHVNPVKLVKRIVQYYMVPLLISAAKTIDELSAAAVTRGIDNPGERSCWKYRGMGIADGVLIAVSVCLIIFAVQNRVNII